MSPLHLLILSMALEVAALAVAVWTTLGAAAGPLLCLRRAMSHPIATRNMRTESLAFVAVLLLLPISMSAADAVDAVPRLDVNSSCKLEAAEAAGSQKQCLTDELQARDTLVKQWGQFPASDRQRCTQAATMGGTSSYVELLTCLEMAALARKLPKE